MKGKSFGKILKRILPVAVAVGLIIVVYSKIDVSLWINELRNVNLGWFFVLLIIGLIQGFVSTFGWKISLNVLKINIKVKTLLYYYLLGGFISYLLPGTVGGDAAKLVLAGKDDKKYKESFVALVMQRILGVFVAITFFFIPVVFATDLIKSVELKVLVLLTSFFIVGLIILLIFSEKVSSFFYQFVEIFKIKRFTKFVGDILDIFSLYRKHPLSLLSMGFTSLLFQVVSLFFRYVILLALNIQVGIFDFLSVVIIVTVIVQIPISMAGVGVREGSYLYFYSQLGVASEKALAFSLLEYIPGLILNSIAIMIFIVNKMHKKVYKTNDK